jgi:hypothetical protein
MSITYISNSAQSKELNMSRWIHTIDIIQLLKAGLTDKHRYRKLKLIESCKIMIQRSI